MMMMMYLACAVWVMGVAAVASPVNLSQKPSAAQLEFQDMELAQFIHFSICTFALCEQNTPYHPAEVFNPTSERVPVEQWVQVAKLWGAKEICLTTHHSGGFCLWPTNASNYSVASSPYQNGKGDIVRDFVDACVAEGIRPCFYIIPPWDNYDSHLDPDTYVAVQMQMLQELMTNYGPVSRFWFDFYRSPFLNPAFSPQGSFPEAWDNVTALVRSLSPSTLMLPGADGCLNPGESGTGAYPVMYRSLTQTFYTCNPKQTPVGPVYAPKESDLSIQNPGDKWFYKPAHVYLNASKLWTKYLKTVGRGSNFILNLPPDMSGAIPDKFVTEVQLLGQAISASFDTPLASVDGVKFNCNGSSYVTLNTNGLVFDSVILREDLTSSNQVVKAYNLQTWNGNEWTDVSGILGKTIGQKVIDIFDKVDGTASSIRFACTAPLVVGETKGTLRHFGVYLTHPPPE